jgi:hypothetical protein
MTKEMLAERIQEISKGLNESSETVNRIRMNLEMAINHHNALLGRYEEAKDLYQKLEKNASESVEPIVEHS